MTDAPSNPQFLPIRNTDTAPFIYFDAAAAYGVMNGAIEVELSARALIPNWQGPTTAEIIPTARLRCSPVAAASLRDTLNNALEMLKQLTEQAGPAASGAATSKLN